MSDSSIELIKLIVSIIATIVAAITLYKAYMEYQRQGVVKKVEILLEMRTRLREDPSFSNICGLLENDSIELRNISLIEKDRFTGFFEELALIKNSGLINNQVAVYMFGYYAEKCSDSTNFWYGLNKNEVLWSAFFDFAMQMKMAHSKYTFDKKGFKL